MPIVSDICRALESLFTPDEEIALAEGQDAVLALLADPSEARRKRLGASVRRRVLAQHTSLHRARELEGHLREARLRKGASDRRPALAAGA